MLRFIEESFGSWGMEGKLRSVGPVYGWYLWWDEERNTEVGQALKCFSHFASLVKGLADAFWGGAVVEKVLDGFENVTCYWQVARRGKIGNRFVKQKDIGKIS